jgi:putative hydrolase of the HAD superfamily
MLDKEIKAVFFDCWGTILNFKTVSKDWDVLPLKRHCVNKEPIDWEKVEKFIQDFYHDFYATYSLYEISSENVLRLTCLTFNIKLDCSYEVASLEELDAFKPTPVKGIEHFLEYLEKHGIYYAILSNTVYDQDKTFAIIKKALPKSHFGYYFASSKVGVKKPNPEFFRVSMIPSGYSMKEAAYIGDSPREDVDGSFKAGFKKTIWLNSRKLGPSDYAFIKDYKKIPYEEYPDYDALISSLEDSNK